MVAGRVSGMVSNSLVVAVMESFDHYRRTIGRVDRRRTREGSRRIRGVA